MYRLPGSFFIQSFSSLQKCAPFFRDCIFLKLSFSVLPLKRRCEVSRGQSLPKGRNIFLSLPPPPLQFLLCLLPVCKKQYIMVTVSYHVSFASQDIFDMYFCVIIANKLHLFDSATKWFLKN